MTVDCKDWDKQINLASHAVGVPVRKPRNEKIQFEVTSIIYIRHILYIIINNMNRRFLLEVNLLKLIVKSMQLNKH